MRQIQSSDVDKSQPSASQITPAHRKGGEEEPLTALVMELYRSKLDSEEICLMETAAPIDLTNRKSEEDRLQSTFRKTDLRMKRMTFSLITDTYLYTVRLLIFLDFGFKSSLGTIENNRAPPPVWAI